MAERPRVEVIVSRYREDISWVRDVPFPVTVYNKGEEPTELEEEFTVIPRPNVGREGETFLHHIIEHYDTLPEYLVMLQGNPFDHSGNLLSILKEPYLSNKLIPLSTNWKYETLTADFNWAGFKDALLHMADMLGVPHDARVRYATGAQYIVPRERILSRTREEYRELHALLATEVNPLSGWALERLWPYVFQSESTMADVGISIQHEHDKETLSALLNRSTDYVVLVPEGSEIIDEHIPEALLAYPILKAGFKMENDLALALAPASWGVEGGAVLPGPNGETYVQVPACGAFLTHRSVLLQHFSFLERTMDAGTLMRERNIPLLAKAIGR